MELRLDRSSGVPIHDQIREQIVGLVHAGRLRSGDQLPTIRALAIELAVNVNTVAAAYRELHVQGVIATRRGEGTFVRGTPNQAELGRLRQQKLESLVARLFDEAGHLGYSDSEIKTAVATRMTQSRASTQTNEVTR